MTTNAFRPAFNFFLILIPLIISFMGLGPEARALAIFLVSIYFWFTESIPLPVTGLLIPSLAIFTGILDSKMAFSNFGNQILFLFIGSFLFAASMQKHGWDKRMAYTLLSTPLAGKSLKALTWMISLISWTLSMWISNTAACAIITPLAIGILVSLQDQFEDQELFAKYSIRLLLSVAFASSIGGMATPVGSPPNVLAIQFLAEKGIRIDFLGWMLFALPISLIMLFVLQSLLQLRYPFPDFEVKDIRENFKSELKTLGPLKAQEIQVTLCFFLAVFLWVLPGLAKLLVPESAFANWTNSNLSMGAVALFSSLMLFILPSKEGANLEWKDAQDIDWGTILIFGGGLCMGSILSSTGLAGRLGQILFAGSASNTFFVGAMAIVAGILISEFSSNTASTTIIVPILLGTFSHIDSNMAKILVVACTFGASFGFMLPVSTPPNAIVYGTGRIPIREMVKTGVFFDITGFITIFIFVILIFPFLGLM